MGQNGYSSIGLYFPPQVGTPFPADFVLPLPGQVLLYKDSSWTSDMYLIDTNATNFPENTPFYFHGSDLQDAATWIAFCLPVGTVCTLFSNAIPKPPAATPLSLAGAGKCVDLIGDGQFQVVDLSLYGANDCLSAGIWRQVDLTDGWFQLFQDVGCAGPFNTIFLAEWPTDKTVSLQNWWICNQASSINCPCLTPPQILTLNSSTDGTGQAIAFGAANSFPHSTNIAVADFTTSGLNDKIQSFSYTIIPPVNVVIDAVTITGDATIQAGQTYTGGAASNNSGSQPIQVAVTVADQKSYTVTTQVIQQYTVNESLSMTNTIVSGTAAGVGLAQGRRPQLPSRFRLNSKRRRPKRVRMNKPSHSRKRSRSTRPLSRPTRRTRRSRWERFPNSQRRRPGRSTTTAL